MRDITRVHTRTIVDFGVLVRVLGPMTRDDIEEGRKALMMVQPWPADSSWRVELHPESWADLQDEMRKDSGFFGLDRTARGWVVWGLEFIADARFEPGHAQVSVESRREICRYEPR